jgi:hypothetical protein
MNTNEEQACGACGEPASIHPVDGPNGVLKCGVYVEPGRDLKRLRLTLKARPKRPDPTPEQERALERRQVISERIQENLRQRQALFAAGAEADAECPEWDRLAPNALVDIEAITYGLGTCEAFLPRELSDDRKRRWHLILDPIEDPRAHGFMLFREPADPSQAPSEALLEALRGTRVQMPMDLLRTRDAQIACALDDIKGLEAERARLRAAFFEVARSLLPDATSELEAVPIQDAVISMLGRVDQLRETAKGAEQRIEKIQGEWSKSNSELNTAAVERDRARKERDNARAQLEAQPFDSDQLIRLAYLLGCERVPFPAVGAKAIEVIEAALEGLGAKTGDSLLNAVARHRERIEVKPKVKAKETAGTEILSGKHQLGQEFTKAIERLDQADQDAAKSVARISGRLGEIVGSIRDANAGWAGTAARVERLENWRRRISARPNGAPVLVSLDKRTDERDGLVSVIDRALDYISSRADEIHFQGPAKLIAILKGEV